MIKKYESKDSNEINWKKCELIYGRLFDLIFKLDHIGVEADGAQYLNLQELVTDKHLQEKFEVIKDIWVINELTETNIRQIIRKDWNSILDAIQKDISQITNDSRFTRLKNKMEKLYENQVKQDCLSIDKIFYID